MFTGIVTDIGRVLRVDAGPDTRFTVATVYETKDIQLGASIACAGACLTVVDKGPGWFAVEASRETLTCTTLADWRPGHAINLERSLKLGDELGGHLVSGHVDGVASVVSVEPEGGSRRCVFAVPDSLARFVAVKGSLAVDGVSLTVNRVDGARVGVNIIPHTWTHTTFQELRPGSRVNLEVDMLARYVARLISRE
jgi:riboflavin synthase